MKEEDRLLQKRFRELRDKAYQNGTYYMTGFLSMAEVALLYETFAGAENTFSLYGGAEGCERVIARFGVVEELGYEVDFPIAIIKVEPLVRKFSDALTHRDYLGAIMNLGIERDRIGDIVLKEKTAYVFVAEKIAEYIRAHLDKVKHTNVKCTQIDKMPEEVTVTLEECQLIVSSLRIDGILAKMYHLSRSQALQLFAEKKVYVNSRLCENNSYQLKEKDVVAARGFGKFIFAGNLYRTKKDKECVKILRYV